MKLIRLLPFSVLARVIIYRDGVGDGQIEYVYEHELEVIRKTVAEATGCPDPKLTFVVVSKRINTRYTRTRITIHSLLGNLITIFQFNVSIPLTIFSDLYFSPLDLILLDT